MSPDRLLRIPEVAECLGYERSHCYALIRQGKLPVPVIRGLGDMRVSERALNDWMRSAGEVPRPVEESVPEPRRRRAQVSPAGDTIIPFPG